MRKLVLIVCTGCLLAAANAASAQSDYDFSATALVGVGGGIGEDGVGFGNGTFQLGFSMATESDILLGLRVGQMSFAADDRIGDLSDFDLTYASVVGEYLFSESYYTSGVYIGLGAYNLGARRDAGGSADESSIGFTLGLTGEFDITRSWAVRLEVAGHVLPSTEISTIGTALVGAAYRF